MTLKKNKSDPESRAFWAYVEETAARVKAWPEWKRRGDLIDMSPTLRPTVAAAAENPPGRTEPQGS